MNLFLRYCKVFVYLFLPSDTIYLLVSDVNMTTPYVLTLSPPIHLTTPECQSHTSLMIYST